MENTPQSPETTRRTFWLAAIHGAWALITGTLGISAIAYLLIPPRSRRAGEYVEAANLRLIKPGMPTEVVFRRNRVDGWRVTSEKNTAWVVKLSGQDVVAYAPQCTHLGCVYHWDQNKNEFVCPCHNSIFSIEGKVVDGPAPRPLDRYQTKVEGEKLLLGSVRQSNA